MKFPELAFVRCRACGVIFKSEQAPGLGVGYEAEYFRFNRAKYLSRWNHRVRKCARQLLVCLEFAPHAKDVLDVGCSAGYVLEAAHRLGVQPTGVDLSRFAVSLCRERGYAEYCVPFGTPRGQRTSPRQAGYLPRVFKPGSSCRTQVIDLAACSHAIAVPDRELHPASTACPAACPGI
ncbi:MAG: class I SAM-dependent methyltransferase [Myxococcales bacterium]|nr:class I SAM-dependent methyltransferase [Myxococcales bacterium]